MEEKHKEYEQIKREYLKTIRDFGTNSLKLKLKFMRRKGLNLNNSTEYRILNEEIQRREKQNDVILSND